LNEWLAEQRSISARAGASQFEVYREHQAIHDAIARHDPIAAQAAMDAHLATVSRNYWKAMQPSARQNSV
jgi:DNA-binding FadR family transcriptional regulator